VANNYLQFSEVVPHLTEAEEPWLEEQLQTVCVFGAHEYAEDAVPTDLADAKPDWTGVRFLRDKKDHDAQWDALGFEFSFGDDAPTGWGRHLWLYAEESGEPGNVAHLVQKFLKKFRSGQCWGLTYAATCSKPRVGEFDGGAVFVTAKRIYWQDGCDFIERKRAAFKRKPAQRRKGKA